MVIIMNYLAAFLFFIIFSPTYIFASGGKFVWHYYQNPLSWQTQIPHSTVPPTQSISDDTASDTHNSPVITNNVPVQPPVTHSANTNSSLVNNASVNSTAATTPPTYMIPNFSPTPIVINNNFHAVININSPNTTAEQIIRLNPLDLVNPQGGNNTTYNTPAQSNHVNTQLLPQLRQIFNISHNNGNDTGLPPQEIRNSINIEIIKNRYQNLYSPPATRVTQSRVRTPFGRPTLPKNDNVQATGTRNNPIEIKDEDIYPIIDPADNELPKLNDNILAESIRELGLKELDRRYFNFSFKRKYPKEISNKYHKLFFTIKKKALELYNNDETALYKNSHLGVLSLRSAFEFLRDKEVSEDFPIRTDLVKYSIELRARLIRLSLRLILNKDTCAEYIRLWKMYTNRSSS